MTAWNNTDNDATITFKYILAHLGPGGSWSYGTQDINVPAKSSTSFNIIIPEVAWQGWLQGTFHAETGKQIGFASKGIWMFYPAVNVTAQTDKTLYAEGETVNLTLTLQNKQNAGYTTTLKVRVSDPSNTSIYNTTIDVSMGVNATSTQNLSFALPSTAQGGYYIVSAEAYDATNKKIGGDSASFELPLSQISVTPNLPSGIIAGDNTFSFTLDNKGKTGVSSGTLDISLKDPDGTVIYSGTQPFAIGVGQNITLNFPISIPSLKFGNYTLTYTQSDETRTGKPSTISIPDTTTVVLSFDKDSYRIRETTNLIVSLTNTGKFNLDPSTGSGVSVTVSVPDVGFTNTQAISLFTAYGSQFTYPIPIPETTVAGQHDVNVTLALPSGSSIAQSSKFTIPESSLTIDYSGSTAPTAGETISLAVENIGGVDTSYTTEKLSITDGRGVVIYQGSVTGSILAGEKKTLADIQIPSQTVNGPVFLDIQIRDTKTSKPSYLYKTFEITGLTATLQTMTNKEAYLKTEAITGLASIANGAFGIEGGSLKLTVNKIKTSGTGQFTYFFGGFGSGDGQFSHPYGIAVAFDGSVYVTDCYNYRIQKFDNKGNFITKWGNYGSGDGQFKWPFGIAVNQGGFVYVVDHENHRIQKFDSNGNFINKWGSYGSGDGQFKRPTAIAASLDGFIYVTDIDNHRIQKFDSNGNFITKWGSYGVGNGQFKWPLGIDVASDGSVYVADTWNYRIQKFDNNGNFITKWGVQGVYYDARIFGIAVGLDGSIYVADTDNYSVQKYDSIGNFITKWSEGQFYSPIDIAIDPDGTVYVVEAGNHRVQKMTPVGGGTEKLFETTIPINQSANTTQEYTTNIGTLNITGKLYLNAELKNSLGQIIATSEYPFYVIGGNTLLLFSTDKKYYRPNETVTITGEVRNLAEITASALSLQLSANSQNIYTATFDVPANGGYPFIVTTTASTEGTYTLTGKVTQNNSTLVEIADQYEVAQPKVSVSVSMSEVVGNEPFDITVEMKNESKVEAALQFGVQSSEFGDSQTITIPAGETKLLQYRQQITGDTTYTFTFTGDLEQTITKTVSYGLSVSVNASVSAVYPEGKIAIPVTITNTGQLDETLTVAFGLQPSAISQNKSYYIPKGGSTTDTLYYDLTEGSYQLSAISTQPSASVTANFSVRKENKVGMTVAVGSQTNGLIPVTVNLTNLGYNEISGSVSVSVSGQNAVVWSSSQGGIQLTPNASRSMIFNINPSAIEPGIYTLKAELLNNGGQQLAVYSSLLTVHGATFQITQLPEYQTFTVGQEATFTFKVKNTGNQEGGVDLNFKAYDLIDSTQTEWLKPGEEKEISFSFMLPEDLEEKDYFADYELKVTSSQQSVAKGQVKYHLAGINLNVSAMLDKQYYSEGETAHLTITVSTLNSQLSALNLFARVNYNGYENQQSFTLNGSRTLTFDISLTQITGEKLFYGIYSESGRSIHLNSIYIYKAGDVITITTDKQVYNPGETVTASVTGNTSGTMTLIGPGNYTETFEFAGTVTKSFPLPSTMSAGTYYISGQLSVASGQVYTEKHAIDVDGIQVKVLECKNDKGKYASSDSITTNFTISSNTTMSATLKAWIANPEGKYTSAGESSISLSSSENLLSTNNYSLSTAVSGIHRLVYGIYTGGLLLASGSEAFDVGDAVILGLSTDKTDYPTNTKTVNATVSLYGAVDASLELQLDGTTVKSESVSLNGFSTLNIELGTVKPGNHTLKGILTAGGLTSTKEASFVYGSDLPDLVVSSQQLTASVEKDNTVKLTFTVTNRGKTTSDATTIALYDGNSLIETKAINALNSAESQEITFIWNILGKAGEHTIKAEVDPDNTVIEFNEENNTAQMTVTIPEITLITETDKDTYKIRHKVNINTTITNLTSTKAYQNLTLVTSAKDPSGNEVYQSSTLISTIEPLNTITHTETWNTSGLQTEGAYTITQTVTSNSQLLTQNSKLITLQKAPDFTMRTDIDYQKIKQGERAMYTAYLESVNGWNSEITLSIEGLPSGTSVSFSPGNLIPPGESLTVIITTDATTTGTHSLTLTAQGVDEGEIVTHTLPLTLDVSGFELSAEPSNKTIKQLETATFDISINSLNGYEEEINLNVDGVPYGMKASFDSTKSQVPGRVKLTVQTSKYAKQGTYALTIIGDDSLVKHKLDLNLILNLNPDIAAGIITTQGSGPNNEAEVKAFNSNLQTVLDLIAFNTKYGAYATGADIDGDGYDEIIVSQGPDPKNSATLRAFKRNGTFITEYTAFDTKYGLTLSSGDIDGDWKDELIVGMGPDPKNPATLKILKYNGTGFTEVMNYTAFDTKYGLNTAIGDIDGDGIPEIIAAPGPGSNNSAVVTVWKYEGQLLTEVNTISAFEGSYGANIAAGDIDGDGKAEIIIGTGPNPKNPAIVRAYKADGTLIMELRPYDAEYGYGVYVSSADMNEDGIDDIITGLGSGPQNPSWVKVFKADGSEIASFMSYSDSVKYGIKVFSGRIGN